MSNKCKNCGIELNEGEIRCGLCGTLQTDVENTLDSSQVKTGNFKSKKVLIGTLITVIISICVIAGVTVLFSISKNGHSGLSSEETKSSEEFEYPFQRTNRRTRDLIKSWCYELAQGTYDITYTKYNSLTIDDCNQEEYLFSFLKDTKGNFGYFIDEGNVIRCINYDVDSPIYDALERICHNEYVEIDWSKAYTYALDFAGEIVSFDLNTYTLPSEISGESAEKIIESLAVEAMTYVKEYFDENNQNNSCFEKYNQARVPINIKGNSDTGSKENYVKREIIRYTSDYYTQYDEEEKQHYIYWSCKNDYGERVRASGDFVNIKIENASGEIVYNKKIDIDTSNFSDWLGDGDLYGRVVIPDSSINQGNNEKGNLYFSAEFESENKIYGGANFVFEENSSANTVIDHLPVKSPITVILPQMGEIYTERDYYYETDIQTEVIDVTYKVGQSNRLTLTLKSTMIYNSQRGTSRWSKVAYKLKNSEGVIVESSYFDIKPSDVGETSLTEETISGLEHDTYTLELLDKTSNE